MSAFDVAKMTACYRERFDGHEETEVMPTQRADSVPGGRSPPPAGLIADTGKKWAWRAKLSVPAIDRDLPTRQLARLV
jgi:hypothetical protein